MLAILAFADACTAPFEDIGEGCYFYSGDSGYIVDSYDAATTLCANEGGTLAIVNTGDKNTAILEYFFSETRTFTGKNSKFSSVLKKVKPFFSFYQQNSPC